MRLRTSGSNTDLFYKGSDFLLSSGHLFILSPRPAGLLSLTSRKPIILIEFCKLSHLFGLGLGGRTDILFILCPTQCLQRCGEEKRGELKNSTSCGLIQTKI